MPLTLPQIADLLRPITQAQEQARQPADDEPTPEESGENQTPAEQAVRSERL